MRYKYIKHFEDGLRSGNGYRKIIFFAQNLFNYQEKNKLILIFDHLCKIYRIYI
jgi:hypothetical protein